MRNETYLRMLILLLPFVDFHFCSSFQYNKKELESKILLYLKYHGHIENVDIAKNIISFYYDKKNYDVDDFIEILEKILIEMRPAAKEAAATEELPQVTTIRSRKKEREAKRSVGWLHLPF